MGHKKGYLAALCSASLNGDLSFVPGGATETQVHFNV